MLNRFKEEAEVLFFPTLILFVFCTEKYIHFVITAQFKCPGAIQNILKT